MTDKLTAIFKEGKPLTRKELAARGAGSVEALLEAGEIVKVKKDSYATPAMAGMATGLFRDSGRGYGFVSRTRGETTSSFRRTRARARGSATGCCFPPGRRYAGRRARCTG